MFILHRPGVARRVLWSFLAAAGCALCPLHLGAAALAYFGLRSAAWHPPAWAEVLVAVVVLVVVEVWWHRRHRASCKHGHSPKHPLHNPGCGRDRDGSELCLPGCDVRLASHGKGNR